MTPSKSILKKKTGQVIKLGSERTATVLVERVLKHPLYHKKYKIGKNYLCENPKNQFIVGDLVEIAPCRPLSKNKHYFIVKKIK